jgi:hypothetical protein
MAGAPFAPVRAQGVVADSAQIVATIKRFHGLIAAGDSLGALALLTDDAVVIESGGFENKTEFREDHLARGHRIRKVHEECSPHSICDASRRGSGSSRTRRP